MSRRGAVIWSGSVGLFLLVAGLVLYRVLCPYVTWDEPGPMVVMSNDKEIWVFAQIDRKVKRPSGEHPVIRLAHSLEVMVFNQDGLLHQWSQRDASMTIHPNCSAIWHGEGGTMLHQYESAYSPARTFAWHVSTFVPAVTMSQREREIADADIGDRSQMAKALSLSHGWNVQDFSRAGNDHVSWMSAQYRFRWSVLPEGSLRLTVVGQGDDPAAGATYAVDFDSFYDVRPRRISVFKYSAMGGR